MPEFYEASDPRQRADVLRYVLLFLYGGVYVDMDFECLRPLDELLHGVDAFAAKEDDAHEAISIGILGCERHHRTFWELVAALPESLSLYSNIGEQTGPSFLTRMVRQNNLELTVFGSRLFYPYQGSDAMRGIAFNRNHAPDAYAVHHWASINQVRT